MDARAEADRILAELYPPGSPSPYTPSAARAQLHTPPEDDEYEAAVAREVLRERSRREARRILDEEAIATSPTTELRVMTARELSGMPDPPGEDRLLGDLIVRGERTVIGAHTGEGKTTFTTRTIAAVVNSGEFLGQRGGGGRALVIDAEQGLRSIKKLLREAGLASSDLVDYMRVPDGLALDRNPKQRDAVEKAIAGGDYSVVAADPLYKLHSGDSNAEREAVDLMRVFDRWREEYRFGLILPVHCRKPPPGARFSMHEFFGSSAYLRGAEVVLGLTLVREGVSHLWFFKDRDGDLPVRTKWELLFSREEGYRLNPDAGKKRTAKDVVADLLANEPMTTAELVKASGYGDRTVRGALKAMCATERTGRSGLKVWSLPADEEGDEQARLWGDEGQ